MNPLALAGRLPALSTALAVAVNGTRLQAAFVPINKAVHGRSLSFSRLWSWQWRVIRRHRGSHDKTGFQ